MKGKLDIGQLKKNVLGIVKHRRHEVLLGGTVSEDCALLKLNGYVLVSADPITSASCGVGRFGIDVSANDISAAGGIPICALVVIIAPESATPDDVRRVMVDAETAAERRNIEICGGHTEFSDSVTRIITVTTVIGVAEDPKFSAEFSAGESILMTKTAGIEGTGIICSDHADEAGTVLSAAEIKRGKKFLDGISVQREGEICGGEARGIISAMHDVTEGGVFGAVYEMCRTAKVGAVIDSAKIPLAPVTEKLCRGLGLDPFRLISSGSMLIITKYPDEVISAMERGGVPCACIGKTTKNRRVYAQSGGVKTAITGSWEELYRL